MTITTGKEASIHQLIDGVASLSSAIAEARRSS